MEFRQIIYFDAVCRAGSISRAAQELFVTQQCVSKQIAMLEKELGTSLLIRSQSGVSLTEEGQWFHEHASVILQMDHDIQIHFEQLNRNEPQILRIGIANGINLFYDESFFIRFREAHPELVIQVYYMWEKQIEEMLAAGTLDIGISVLPVSCDALYAEKLFEERFYCIVNRNHRLAYRESLSLDDILHDRIAMADENYTSYNAFQIKCMQRGVEPDVYKSPDIMSIYEQVLNHNAVGFSLVGFADRFHIDQIVSIPHSDPDAKWEIGFLTRAEDRSRYKNLSGDFLRDKIQLN